VPREALCTLVSRASRLCEALLAWPDEAPLGEHLDRVQDLVVQALGWTEEEPACAPLLGTLAQLAADLPASMRMDGQEFLLLLRGACDVLGSRPLGGAGAGVQVLDATEARARTFTHLFVLGMNRDLFPRVVLEDPLLPDSLRRGLLEHGTGVLPDLPLKLGGFEEERYLFAQLLTASPHVTLSWQSVDDDGPKRLTVGMPVAAAICMPALSTPMNSLHKRKTAANVPMDVLPARLYVFDGHSVINSSALARSSPDPVTMIETG